MQDNQTKTDWKTFLRETLFEGENTSVKRFETFILVIIFLSVITVLVEIIFGISDSYYQLFYILEWIFTIIFTIEYLLRAITARSALKYIFSFEGILDLLATIPLYLMLIFSGKGYVMLFRLLRASRILSRMGRFRKTLGKKSYFYKRMKEVLGPNEKVRAYFKRSRLSFFLQYFIASVLFIISIIEIASQIISVSSGNTEPWVQYMVIIIFICSTVMLVYLELKILNRRYALTNHRVLMDVGILHTHLRSTTYHFIADTELYQSFSDKIMDIGEVSIKTTGNETDNIVIKKVRSPLIIKKIIHDNAIRAHHKPNHT